MVWFYTQCPATDMKSVGQGIIWHHINRSIQVYLEQLDKQTITISKNGQKVNKKSDLEKKKEDEE